MTRAHIYSRVYIHRMHIKVPQKSSDSSERFDDTAIQLTARHPATNYFTRTQQDASLALSLCVTLHLLIQLVKQKQLFEAVILENNFAYFAYKPSAHHQCE